MVKQLVTKTVKQIREHGRRPTASRGVSPCVLGVGSWLGPPAEQGSEDKARDVAARSALRAAPVQSDSRIRSLEGVTRVPFPT